jgi:protein required for attachment to host cells
VDGGKSGSSMMSKKTQQKMKKKIKGAVMQSLEADAKSASESGDTAKEGGKKKLAQMTTSAANDQQWNFMTTDADQDRIAVEQKRILVERGQELLDKAKGDYTKAWLNMYMIAMPSLLGWVRKMVRKAVQ